MKYKIGVFGSAAGEEIEIKMKIAEDLGHELAKHNCIVINGACDGLPYKAAYTAAKEGADVWGYSPGIDLVSHMKISPTQDISMYKKLIYTPPAFPFVDDLMSSRKYRNIISTFNCDAGIIISGRWGTMNEFTNLYDMGKVIGVLTGSGGVADEIKNLMTRISKKTKAIVIFDSSPKALLEKIMNSLHKQE